MKGLDRIPQNIYLFPVSLLVLGVCAMSYVADSAAMDSGEFIVFPTVDITSRNSVNSLEQKNTEPKTDFFYTQDFGNQRILVEALAEPEQDQSQLDVERLQYGWILNLVGYISLTNTFVHAMSTRVAPGFFETMLLNLTFRPFRGNHCMCITHCVPTCACVSHLANFFDPNPSCY